MDAHFVRAHAGGVNCTGHMQRIILTVALAIFLAGCAESSFTLSPESRLPKWFDLPEGETRSDVTVTLTYFIGPFVPNSVFELKSKDGTVYEKVEGKRRSSHPIHLDGVPYTFEVITINGITDVIEHRAIEPTFHTNNDPKVWEMLKLVQENGS